MKRKGFTLIEVIVGMFLIGLVATLGLPIMQNSFNNYNRVKENKQMIYLCEMVVERLRGKDSSLEDIFNDLEYKDEISLSTIGSTDLGKYKCKIIKTKAHEMYMNLDVRIYIENEMGNSPYVEYKTVIKR